MKGKAKVIIAIILLIIVIVFILWINGTIPKLIGKQVAIKYVNENYGKEQLEFEQIEFATSYGNYIVSFKNDNGDICNFKLDYKYFPTSVIYDSILGANI